jgi:glycosyltransferase involved in cell wall biosynthesis
VSVVAEKTAIHADPAAGIRVAMVIQPFRPVLGGAQRQLERLGPLLSHRGVAATVLTRRPPGTAPRERIADLDVRRLYTPATPAAASIAYSLGAAAALTRLRPDVIHVHGLLSPATAALLGGITLRAPVVAKALASGPEGDIHSLLRKPLGRTRLREASRRFAAFIAISRETEAELTEFGIPAGRIVRIPNGVDVSAFRPPRSGERERLRAELGFGPDETLAIYCGRFAAPKRVALLIETFRRLGKGSLLLFGSGPEEARLRQLAADPELEGRVEVRSAMPDTRELYRAADLYVSASIQEGLSGSVLEAMASGLPVATVPASGMRELLGDDAGVLLAADGNAREWAGEVGSLLDEPARRARLGAAARERVCTHYSLESVADRLLELYADLGDRARRAA